MSSLANLTDQQNMLLTQLSYQSDVFKDRYEGMRLEDILELTKDADAKEILKKLCDAGLNSLTIKAVGNDSVTGFGAIAFVDDDGNTGFSFRGTDGIHFDSINDWLDNLMTMATATSPQTVQAEAFFDRYCDPNGNNYLYGHSKGGELSESVYANNYNVIKGVHLLNPQPLNPYSLSKDQLLALQSKKVDIVIVERDYVWFLGKLPSYGNIRIVPSNGKNPHLYESIEDQYDNYGGLLSSNLPWYEYAGYFFISFVLHPIQTKGAEIGMVYNTVVRVVDFVRDDLIPAAREFCSGVCQKLEKLGDDMKQFASELKVFLSDTIARAKEWGKRTFNQGYKYAISNPEIMLDTYKMQQYAQRLKRVNSRLNALDRRMNSLYGKVGLRDLWNLIQADTLTGFSWRLLRCSAYLDDTAKEFEAIESTISKYA